ncbi:DcrB-related protein [Blastococcus sp. TF02A-26]|uniref:DcrB-related protein n=1 Tax=Blastococcus sp. TF02A-26 TaxID=2250577 RepID=UPI000DEBBB59|nr:DcrB-related protein [Blastococcus sp. TF02A-26]RBY87460.1 hypothetical protein DQ240_07695 [Blastococcus sp. TF02A-26]
MPTPYASVGGSDPGLREHAAEVRRRGLPLVPAAEGVTFRLDVDAGGGLLGVTSADAGEDSAVPGFWAGPVTTVVCRELLADHEDFWRSRLVADLPGADDVQLVTGLVDLAHAGPGAYRRGRTTRLRLSLAAERVSTGDAEPALSCPPGEPLAAVTGVVRAAQRRTSGRTGRSFAVLTVDTAGLALDVCAAPEVLADLPAEGSTVTAVGRLVGVFAGTVGELAPELSPDVEPPLVVTARPVVVPRAPVPLLAPADAADRPASTPLLELPRSAQVLAPMVHTAGATDAGVVACCVDWDGRWQLRRFAPGAVVPDGVVDLAGHPEQCVVHRGGVAVVVGRELLVLDAGLQLLHRTAFPPHGLLHLVASPSAVHVLVTEPAGPADAPDDAGRRAVAQGATVHRYRLHRLDLVRLGDPAADPWQRMQLPVSGIYPPTAPSEVPGWVEPTAADTRGEGLWFAVPGRDAWDRPAQHHLTVSAEGALAMQTDPDGPPWATGRLRHGEVLLTADSSGPAVDGRRPASTGPVAARLLTGEVPAAVATRFDGQGTVLFELRAGGWTQVAATPRAVLVSSAVDRRTAARWYGFSGSDSPGVLGVVTGEGALRPVLQTREPFALVAVAADAAVATTPSPGAPVLDLRDGRLRASAGPGDATARPGPGGDVVVSGPEWTDSRLRARVPDGWSVAESWTLRAPDGQSTVVVSREPLPPGVGAEQYAQGHGDRLVAEFPQYQQHVLTVLPLASGPAYARLFSWAAPGGARITQVQVYATAPGTGFTASATTSAASFGAVAQVVDDVLRSLDFDTGAPRGAPAPTGGSTAATVLAQLPPRPPA